MPARDHLAFAPELEGWLTLGDVAGVLGCTRQNVFLLAQAGEFSTLRRVGQRGTCYVVTKEEAERVRDRREQASWPDCEEGQARAAALRLAGLAVAARAGADDLAVALEVLGVIGMLRTEREAA